MPVSKVILPIKQGEQLFVTLENNLFDMTADERNDQLEKNYGFRCKCKICRNGILKDDVLHEDPAYIDMSLPM